MTPAIRLPAYALYGESGAAPPAPALHCESIAARSRVHGWQILPHRHESLFQLLLVRRGRVEATLDGGVTALRGPAALTVPPLAAHGFRFSPGVDGLVFTVGERHLRDLTADDDGLHAALSQPRAWALPRDSVATAALAAAAEALRDEIAGAARWRGAAVDAALLRLTVAAARTLPDGASPVGVVPERALAHVRRLRQLVDAQYREQPSLASLAAHIGITPTQLNRACRRVLGHTALGVMHARLTLEAQRQLAYTTLSVKQIGFELGFADAAYFTRFFARQTGSTPSAWRARAAAQAR